MAGNIEAMRFERGSSGFNIALLAYVVLVVLVITLAPFEFRVPDSLSIRFSSSIPNLLSNIVLFVPVGFLFSLAQRRIGNELLLDSLGFGLGLSALIELAQLFVVGRYTSMVDLLANGTGAWIGGFFFYLMTTKVKEPGERVFFLELPLMKLVYLLIPLLWVNGLALGMEQSRLGLTTLLGMFGCGVMVSVFVNRLDGHSGFTPVRLGLAAFLWVLVSCLPAIPNFPFLIPGIAVVLGGVTALCAHTGIGTYARDRRFELPTLRAVVPFYATYLFLLTAWPTTVSLQNWGTSLVGFSGRVTGAFQLVEILAAFTLLGYIIAEMRGRISESAIWMTLWVFLVTSTFLLWMAAVQWLWYESVIDSRQLVLPLVGSLFGGLIYRLQLAALRQRSDPEIESESAERATA